MRGKLKSTLKSAEIHGQMFVAQMQEKNLYRGYHCFAIPASNMMTRKKVIPRVIVLLAKNSKKIIIPVA